MKYFFYLSLVLMSISNAFGQAEVTGTVTSDEGDPLPGVNVIVKGTANGVVTDFDGNYTINIASPDTAILVFSYLGFQTLETPVLGQIVINISLTEGSTELDEVVVVGYGEQSKAKVTGSITSVKAEDLENRPVSSFENSLQGKAAGVQVVQNSGAPGGGATVRIRGIASISGGNEPLYVVDGVPIKSGNFGASGQLGSVGLNALADINPNDIASIEVLKDASAASIYGSRASNGVVLITTKRGSAGKPSLNVSSYYGFQKITDYLSTVNAGQFRERFYEGWFQTAGNQMRPEIADILNPSTGGDNNTNWQDEIFRDASIQNLDLSLTGGSEKVKFALSTNYFNQEGILVNTGYKRISTRMNVDYQAYDNIKLGASVSYSNGKNKLAFQVGDNNAVRLWINTPPYQTPFPLGEAETWIRNPVNQLEAPQFESRTNRLIGNIYGEVKIATDLTFRSSIGLDLLSLQEDLFIPSNARNFGPFRNASARFFQDLGYINENTLNYNTSFGDDHSLDVLLGFGWQENQIESIFASGSEAPSDKIPTVNASATLVSASSRKENWGLVSYFGRVNYGFKDRYLLTGTIRTDGSSRFGSANRFGTFPSGAFAWRASEEPFMEGSKIENLKFRVSYGSTGNQEGIGNYVSQGLFTSNSSYLGIGGFAPASNGIPNDELTWERTNQLNAGMDIGLFKNRISFSADYYQKTTKDLLFNVQLPGTTGFSNLTTNLGSVENNGIELTLNTQNFVNKFKWSTSLNISFNSNRITELPNGEDFFVFGSNGSLAILQEGESLGSFYGFIFDGVYSTIDDVPAGPNGNDKLRSFSENGPEFQAGDAIFRDLDNNGIINDDDRGIIGNAIPDFTGGITNNFSYKGFDLNVFFNFSYGNEIYNSVREYRDSWIGLYTSSSLEAWNNRWQQPGDITDVPRNDYRGAVANGRSATGRWIEDGSFLRLKTITLGYEMPRQVLDDIGLNRLRFYVTGQNLLTFTDYSGYDPETVSSSANNAGIFGVDEFIFPLSKSVIFGINLGL